MKIALINENSQASKNNIIYNSLKEVCDEKGYSLDNYGMFDSSDKNLTYPAVGLLAAILYNSGACDFIVTGCGTGQGAQLALNSFPNIFCGLIVDPTDAFLFSQINAGNAISLPYAKGFGWAGEINLKYIFEKLFSEEAGGGYPKERKEVENFNKDYLKEIKQITNHKMIDVLKNIDRKFLLDVIDRDIFKELFFKNATNKEIIDYISGVLDRKM